VRTPEGDDARRARRARLRRRGGLPGWIDIGHAQARLRRAGFSIWDRWSQKSAKYPGATKAAKKWASFNPNGSLKLGTVFELAKRAGYSPPSGPKPRPRADSESALPPSGAAGSGGAGEPGDGRPVIRWVAGKLPEVVDQAEDALLKNGVRIFRRGGFLVRVIKRDVPSVRNYKRPSAVLGWSPSISPSSPGPSRRRALAQVQRQERRLGGLQRPEQVAITYLRRSALDICRALVRDQHTNPATRWDRAQTPGYDADTQSWYDPGGVEFPRSRTHPTSRRRATR
jgi:hypothetical protein